MPKYRVITTFNEGTDDAKGPGEIIELTEEQAGPFVKTKRLAPYTEHKPGGFAREVEKHKLLPDEPQAPPAPEPSGYAQEVEKQKLFPEAQKESLVPLTVKELTSLPEWASVPEPKPTRKADIIAAIRAVREG